MRDDNVRLEKSAVWYDVAEFLEMVSSGDYKTAAALYTGPFLALPGELAGINFEHWRESINTKVQQQAKAILTHLSKAAEAQGEWDDALSYAQKLIQIDPVNATAHLIKLRVLAATEPRGTVVTEATRVRQTFVEWAEPLTKDIAALLDSLERVADSADLADAQRSKFVGRTTEMSLLSRAYLNIQRRETHLATLTGAPGVGKTRLADRFLRWTALRGARVLMADCSPPQQRIPYSAIISAFADKVTETDLESLSLVWRKYLAPLLPGLELGGPYAHGRGAADQQTVFEAAGRLMGALCDRSPVVLFFDNANWLDNSSAWLTHYLFHKLREARLLVVLAFREGEPIASDQLRTLVQSCSDSLLTAIGIAPLNRMDSMELLNAEADRLGVVLAPTIREEILEQAGGIPFHILYRLKETDLQLQFGPQQLGATDLIPQSGSHVAELSDAARRCVEALAVLGRSARIDVLERMVSEAAVQQAIPELVGKRLVRVLDSEVTFVHDILHEQVLKSIRVKAREQLHAQAAVTLALDQTTPASLIALHFAGASRNDAATTAALTAASEAVSAFALKDAEFFFHMAISRAPTTHLRIGSLARYIDFLCEQGRFDDALIPLKQWRTISAAHKPQTVPQNLQLLEIYQSSIAGGVSEDFVAKLAALTEAKGESIDEVGFRTFRIMLQVAHVAGCAPSGDQLSRYVEDNFEKLTTSRAGCELLGVLARLWALYIDSRKAAELANVALEYAEKLRDPMAILTCAASRAVVRMVRGELYGAERDFDSVLAHAENPEFAHLRQRNLNNVGLVFLERGKLAEADAALFEALGLVSGPDHVTIRGNLALVSLEGGVYSEVQRRIADLNRANMILGAPWAAAFTRALEGWVAYYSGNLGEASRLADEVQSMLVSAPPVMDSSYSEAFVARVMSYRDPFTAAVYCEERGSIHRQRYVLGALRLALEGSRCLCNAQPEVAHARARAVLQEAETLGASNIAKQAVSLLSSL